MNPDGDRQLLLFDLDAVLINSAGYYRSLVEAVRQVSLALGFGDRSLEQTEIEAFEALDITAEWDSAALCAGLLLLEAWKTDPAIRLPTQPPLPPAPRRHDAWPDIGAFLDEVAAHSQGSPLDTALDRLTRRLPPGAPGAGDLRLLLDGRRDPDRSLTFWLIQVFNLGSRRFADVYRRHPAIDTPSMLELHDRPTLSPSEVGALRRWLGRGGRWAAVVTNRPASSGDGVFNTPEAEIGLEVSGLAGLPFIAAGHLGASAAALGLAPQTFLKPSPVHLLAGLGIALDGDRSASLERAVRLGHFGEFDPVWRRLDGTNVVLFEDAAKGHRGLQAAAALLQTHGVEVDTTLCGIAAGPPKSEALAAVGARVFASVAQALDTCLPGWRAGAAAPDSDLLDTPPAGR